jgi:hypothetical protein
MSDLSPVPVVNVDHSIFLVRGQKVMLDSELAYLYGVETKILNQMVKRNTMRFPEDFMFQLTLEETDIVLKSQIVTSCDKKSHNLLSYRTNLRSQFVTSSSKEAWGGRRYRPYAFTEQGIAMLSSVLNSPRAIAVNIEIMRAFVRLRQLIASHADLARKLAALEKKYDAQFKIVFDAIRELMTPITPADKKREIGFHSHIKKT